MVIEFNDKESASIKSFAVKKRSQVKITTCFMSGKLLMFAKLSLKSFIYEISEIFCFQKKNITKIYKKYMIEKVEIFHVRADTDSTSLRLIFISDPICDIPETKFRDIIFEVITASDIYKRFDSSNDFWDIVSFKKENRQKKLGYYETENIDNPCLVRLALNLKEYLELLKDILLNKKHKRFKKGSTGIGFKNFVRRIKYLVNFETFEKPPLDQKQVSRFSVTWGEMVKKTVVKSKFSQFNDKRFYFPDEVVFLPFRHPCLSEIDKFKQEKGRKIEKYFWKEKEALFNMEKKH